MSAMAQVNVKVPAEAAPNASFLSMHGGLAQERRRFGPVKELNHQGISLSATPPLVQRRLTIGAVDDPYEHEADRVADMVMRMPSPAIQRKGT